jgi:hypothetical protein
MSCVATKKGHSIRWRLNAVPDYQSAEVNIHCLRFIYYAYRIRKLDKIGKGNMEVSKTGA